VIVRAGLHHLPYPMIGIYEMLRVAKKWILFMEAQDNFITRGIRKLWLVETIEPSGNYVYTFTRREMEKVCNSLFLPPPKIKTFFFHYIPFLHNKIFGKIHWKIWISITKFLFNIWNVLLWRWGNNFICFIKKEN